MVKKAFENGAWRNWLLGIVGTIIASLLVSNIAFQREMRMHIATNEQRIKQLELRDENIIKFMQQRADEQIKFRDDLIQRLERRIERLEAQQGYKLQSDETKPWPDPPDPK